MTADDDPAVAEANSQLSLANRILDREGVLDAYGHVSVRHPARPQHFLLSRDRSPALVTPDDISEFDAAGEPIDRPDDPAYMERYIHAAIYKERPDVCAVAHSHSEVLLPYGISNLAKLRPVIHTAAVLGGEINVWDIAEHFGAHTDLLVKDMTYARSLASALGQSAGVLMRGHGAVFVGGDIQECVTRSIEADKNARVQIVARGLGGFAALADGEIEALESTFARAGFGRAWQYWALRAGQEVDW